MSPESHLLTPSKLSPNSPYPLLHYKGAFEPAGSADIETTFFENGWNPAFKFGMYKQAHYHSNTHEALGILGGSARIRVGASDEEPDRGLVLEVKAGDVLVIPAGVLHGALEMSEDFLMAGAYPAGSPSWDLCYGRSEAECQMRTLAIQTVPMPPKDPYTGQDIWR